jgi:hypothetical protein
VQTLRHVRNIVFHLGGDQGLSRGACVCLQGLVDDAMGCVRRALWVLAGRPRRESEDAASSADTERADSLSPQRQPTVRRLLANAGVSRQQMDMIMCVFVKAGCDVDAHAPVVGGQC